MPGSRFLGLDSQVLSHKYQAAVVQVDRLYKTVVTLQDSDAIAFDNDHTFFFYFRLEYQFGPTNGGVVRSIIAIRWLSQKL